MIYFLYIFNGTISPGVMCMEKNEAILMDLPTSVRGFVFLGEDGDPVIVVNSRLTREQNRKTFRHERRHVRRGDLENKAYKEYEEE